MPENRIANARFQRRLAEELNIDTPAPVPVMAPELQPVIVVEGERPENQHLASEHRYACTLTLGAVAAEYFIFQLWNPSDSGVLVVLEDLYIISISATAAFDIGVAVDTFIPSLSGRAAYCLDARVPQNPLGRPCVAEPYCGTDPNTGSVTPFGRIRTFATTTTVPLMGLNYVLPPGTGFGATDLTVNEGVQGMAIWRERIAQLGELT